MATRPSQQILETWSLTNEYQRTLAIKTDGVFQEVGIDLILYRREDDVDSLGVRCLSKMSVRWFGLRRKKARGSSRGGVRLRHERDAPSDTSPSRGVECSPNQLRWYPVPVDPY